MTKQNKGAVFPVFRKKTRFLAATTVVLLTVQTVSATIVYNYPSLPIDIRRTSDSLDIDIDLTGDGESDLRFSSFLVATDPFMWPYLRTAIFDVTPLSAVRISSFTNIYGTFADPMEAGTIIGESNDALEWSDFGATFSSYFLSINGAVAWDVGRGQLERIRPVWNRSDLDGPTHEGRIGYFALELVIDDETFFGWIEVDTRWDNGGIFPDGGTVTRWAFNSTAGEPIRAGEIPEPSVATALMCALVLAAVGAIRFLRRT